MANSLSLNEMCDPRFTLSRGKKVIDCCDPIG